MRSSSCVAFHYFEKLYSTLTFTAIESFSQYTSCLLIDGLQFLAQLFFLLVCLVFLLARIHVWRIVAMFLLEHYIGEN